MGDQELVDALQGRQPFPTGGFVPEEDEGVADPGQGKQLAGAAVGDHPGLEIQGMDREYGGVR